MVDDSSSLPVKTTKGSTSVSAKIEKKKLEFVEKLNISQKNLGTKIKMRTNEPLLNENPPATINVNENENKVVSEKKNL